MLKLSNSIQQRTVIAFASVILQGFTLSSFSIPCFPVITKPFQSKSGKQKLEIISVLHWAHCRRAKSLDKYFSYPSSENAIAKKLS